MWEGVALSDGRARLTWLHDLGHYPMVEAPERWAQNVVSIVDHQAS